jgi:hypothetical protein
MDWPYRFLLLLAFALGCTSAERTMSDLQPPPMKLRMATLLAPGPLPSPSPPPPPPVPSDPLGAMP